VILATPADKTLAIEAPLRPEDREDLKSVRYIPCVRAILGYRRESAPRIPYITPAGPGKHPLMSLSNLTRWEDGRVPDDYEVVWVSASGWRSVELVNKTEGEIIDGLRRDCAAIGIALPPPEWARVIINRQGMVLPETGHFRRMADFLARERSGLFFAGDWLTGSTVEGAIRSGQGAARAVLRRNQI
jgi:predicted NAD/FAD-dependent oxidoreductase